MRHADTNELVAEPIFVIYAHDLRQMDEYLSERGFDFFSWGDAEYTLVRADELIEDICDRYDSEGLAEWADLLEDLAKANAMGHLIAFDG